MMREGRPRHGALITVRVRPGTRPGLSLSAGVVVVGVSSRPVQGKATAEARKVLATALGVAPSRVRLHIGSRSRTKVFLVAGLDPAELNRRLGTG